MEHKDKPLGDAHQLPLLTPSPYEGSILTTGEQLKISCLWLAINAHWGALLVILLPAEIRHIAPQMRAQALGIFSGLGAIMALAAPLIVGPLSDRCRNKIGRRKPFIGIGIIINLIGLVAMAIVAFRVAPLINSASIGFWGNASRLLVYPPFLLFLLGYLVVQLGSNIASAAYMGFVPDLIPSDQRGLASGYVAVMSQLGTLVGAIGAGLLLAHQSVFIKYGFIGGLLAVFGFITVFRVKENPLLANIEPLNWVRYFRSMIGELKESPDFLWVWITRFMVMIGFYAIQPFINYYLIDVIGFKHAAAPAAKLIGIILIASSISGFYGGKISDRIGRKKVVYWSSISMAIFVVLFTFCRSFNSVLLVGLLFGAGFGAYVSVDWALGADVLPSKNEAGKDMAIWHIAMTLPQSIAPPIAGTIIGAFVVSESLNHKSVHYGVIGYGLVFLFCAICFVSGGYFLKNVRSVE